MIYNIMFYLGIGSVICIICGCAVYCVALHRTKHESIKEYQKKFGEDADEFYLLDSAYMRNNCLPAKYIKRYEELQMKYYGEVLVKSA